MTNATVRRPSPSRPSLTVLVLAAAGALAAGGAARGAAAPQITEFTVPTPNADPGGIAAGPDGDLWFTELNANKVGRITTAGTVVNEFSTGASLLTEVPAGIVEGPDGAMWFTLYSNNQIGRISTSGTVKTYDIPTANSGPIDIQPGPDGNLWFTEVNGNKIGRITTAGAVKEYTVPSAQAQPTGITAGPDGNLWFSETNLGKIGRLSTAGVFKEFTLPDAASQPQPVKITAGPDGNLWFVELSGNQVGRVTPAGSISEFAIPTPSAEAIIIAPGPDGNLWFTELNGNNVASVTPQGTITEYPLPHAASGPGGITTGPDGNLWFTEITGNRVARLTLGGGPCPMNATTLCIDDKPGDKRWAITASYRTAEGGGSAGSGQAISLEKVGVTEGGLFWFFDATNPEMLIKVIDACALNQQYWVFYSATTNVGFTVSVRDTLEPRTKSYTNKDGTAAPPVQDTSAFSCTPANGSADDAGAASSADSALLAPAAAPPAIPAPAALDGAEPRTGCTTGGSTLCLEDRFQIKVSYKTAQGGGSSGNGQAIGLSGLGVAQGGLFWFFNADNPEMLVKVIDACTLNGRYWVFYAAGTNVGFTVTVTDTADNQTKTYTNKDGVAAPPVQDTSALPCPS